LVLEQVADVEFDGTPMKTIAVDLIALIQSQRPSWMVWGAAGFALLVGLTLLVYFITRLRKSDKEADDGWNRSRGSLLQETDRPAPTGSYTSVTRPPVSEKPAEMTRAGAYQHQGIASIGQATTSAPAEPEAITAAEPAAAAPSDAGESGEPEPVESTVLDENVWAELDAAKEAAQPSPSEARAEVPPPRATREHFEPPRIEPIAPRRESYEPPAIVPIVPRQATSPERTPKPAPSARSVLQQTTKSSGAASVLGVPSESPRETLKLGTTSGRVRGAQGIRSLSNYGQPVDDEPKSYAGTIALVIAVAIVGGAVLAYFYVPRFHAWVDNVKMKARGNPTEPQPVQAQAKVKLFPQKPQVEKNQVKAWGYVFNNTADEVLTGLTVELALTKSDGSTETVAAAVKPDELQPGQQGYAGRASFELTYDGKKYTGFKVLRVLSNGVELSYATVNSGT
jgi:hypothetical protein